MREFDIDSEEYSLPSELDIFSTQEFVSKVHSEILGRLYDLAQNDGMLSMALIPLMAHLKKMPKEKL